MRNHHARRLLPAPIAIIRFYLRGRLKTIFRRPRCEWMEMMKKLMFILLIQISATSAFACTPGAGNGPAGDPNCMGGVLSTDPYYNGSQRNSSSRPSKIIRHTVVNVPSKYGALAHSKTGAIAGAINMNSPKEAEKEAIRRCEEGENIKCRVILSVRNGCFAAAIGRVAGTQDDGVIYKAISETPKMAERMVMEQCHSSKSTGCKLIIPGSCSIP